MSDNNSSHSSGIGVFWSLNDSVYYIKANRSYYLELVLGAKSFNIQYNISSINIGNNGSNNVHDERVKIKEEF